MAGPIDGDIFNADEERLRQEEAAVTAGFWPVLKRAARQIPFVEDLVAAYYCALDPATPTRTKAILLGALAYFVLPFDVVPDFILMLGFGDDLAILAAALSAVKGSLKPQHYTSARRALDDDEVLRKASGRARPTN